MAVIRVGISAALGVLVTFALIILMYKLIDSGNKDLDEKETIKIADFLHVDRQLTENAKQTEVEKPEDPETPPPEIPEDNIEFEVPDNAISMAAPSANANLKDWWRWRLCLETLTIFPVYVPQPQYPRRAQTRGKEGYAVIEVVITTTGGTRDPKMIEEFPEGWGFGRAALKSCIQAKVQPTGCRWCRPRSTGCVV